MIVGDEDSLVLNSLVDLEVLIDRPVTQVWNQYLDVGSWVTSHDIEEISEVKRNVGAITRCSFRRAAELGFPGPHFHYCKIIKLISEQQCIIKAYSGVDGSYGGRIVGYDDSRFIPIGERTRWIFRAYSEYRGELVKKSPAKVQSADEDNHMLINMQTLKRLVESRPQS